jgi:hypothetical protein
MINAEDEEFVPTRSRQALQDALRQSGAQLTFETLPGRHVRARDEDVIAQLYSRSSEWMRRQGLVD